MNTIKDYIREKTYLCIKNDCIDKSLYDELGVKRGLRDINGEGVLTGLTNTSLKTPSAEDMRSRNRHICCFSASFPRLMSSRRSARRFRNFASFREILRET